MSMDSKQPPSSPPERALEAHFETVLDRAARAAEPPDYDQLAAYADGTLNDVDREIVESWLESDPELRAEVDELRELRETMSQPAPLSAPRISAASTPIGRGDATAAPGADSVTASSTTASAPASRSSSSVVSFEEAAKRTGAAKQRRFGTATVVMGAVAAAVIAATTWLAVRTSRVDETLPGAAGSTVARQGQPGQPGPPEQAPPLQSRGAGTPQGAANPGQAATTGAAAQRGAGGTTTIGGPGGAAETVALRDAGRPIGIDAAGMVTGLAPNGATPAMTQLVADALTKGTLPSSPATAGLGGRELTLMGAGGSRQPSPARLAPLSPIATIVRTTHPVFRWSLHPGARGYVVTIYGPDFDEVMSSPSLTGTTWTATAALRTGVTYQWQVTADTSEGPVRAPAPPAPDARFRIIDAAAGKALDRDLARAGSSRLLKGLLLTQAGVLDEAEQTFEALQAENPDSKRVADLLARIRDRRLAP